MRARNLVGAVFSSSKWTGIPKWVALGLTIGTVSAFGAGIDWPTYGFNLQRTGENPSETTLTPATVAGLHELWSFDLGAVTITQPIVAAGVTVNGTAEDLVFMGTEHGDFYALDMASGALVWQRNLGSVATACEDIPDKIFGVSGSPVLDRPRNRLFVVGGDGNLYALDLSTGATLTGWPVAVTTTPGWEHTYGALNINNGIAYAELAGYCDFAPYHGRLVAISLSARKVVGTFYPAGPTVSGGGIWGPGGASIDPATGHLFAATGNALTDPEYYRYSDSVVELSPTLKVLGANYPGLTGENVDFGATPILFQPPGCPPLLAAKNKTGVLLTYTRGSVTSGATQRLQLANVLDYEFNGDPAWSDATHLLYVTNSSDSLTTNARHGILALSVDANCRLRPAWQTPIGPNFATVSPPTVAGGVVYYGDGPGNELLAFDATTGALLWSSGTTIGGAIYAAPTVVNGRLLAGAWDGKVHVFGL